MIKKLRQYLNSWRQVKPGLPSPTAPVATASTLPWQDADLEVLLFNETHAQALQIEIPGRSSPFQSWLIGFDLTHNQLLIDSLFPAPPLELLAQQTGFKITLIRQQEVLQLWVCLRETLVADGKPALLVEILHKHYRQDRRHTHRLTFERSRGPLCKLQIPMEPQLRGTLMNLSSGGCLLNIFGKHLLPPDNFQQQLQAQIQLSDDRKIDCRVQIKAIQYFRCPCQHTQLRLKFLGLTLDQQQILTEFLAANGPGSYPPNGVNWQDTAAVAKQQQGVINALSQRGLAQQQALAMYK